MDPHKPISSDSLPKGTNQHSRDYPALFVFSGLVIALFVAGYFALQNLDTDLDFRPGPYLREWKSEIEEKVKSLLGEATKGIQIPGRRSEEARAHLLKGYRLHRQKSYSEALVELNKALEIDPKNAEAYYWRGRTLVNLGKPDLGEEDFRIAVTLKPDYGEAYDQLGWLASRQGKVEEAIGHLNRSVELKPENAWAYYHRSRLFFDKGEVASALKDAEEACRLGYQEGCKAYEAYKNGSREGGQVARDKDD